MRVLQRARAFPFGKVQGPLDWLAFCLGTGFGVSFLPYVPGTWGTLLAVPLAIVTLPWPRELAACFWIVATMIAIWAADHLSRVLDEADSSYIISDEVVGFGLASFWVVLDPMSLAAAFVFFRLFDMIKPPPIRSIDRWSKNATIRLPFQRGFGIVVDDLVAGLFAALCVSMLKSLYILPT